MPKCFGNYKTFLCCNIEKCNFSEQCKIKQAINTMKTTRDKFNLDISNREIVNLCEYIDKIVNQKDNII